MIRSLEEEQSDSDASVSKGVEVETRRRKSTDVQELARQVILSREYQPTLKRRVLAGQINRDFARTLLGYARNPRGWPEESAWLREAPALQTLERIAGTPLDEKKQREA